MTRHTHGPASGRQHHAKSRHSLRAPQRWDDKLSDGEYLKLSSLIERRLGFRMPPNKRVLLQGRMVRRARALGLPTLRDYCQRVLDGGEQGPEFVHFLDIVTTNVTSFFREPKQLELVQKHLQGLAAQSGKRELKVWSAACSRGHEVWTLGMIMSELREAPHFSLLGSDISQQVLEQAVTAIYPEAELSPVPTSWRKRYFMHSKQPDQRLARVVPELRQRARFQRLNLMDAAFSVPTDFDMALLRNVLIYFDASTQREVVNKVIRHLKPGGMLCVGLAESLHAYKLPLEHVQLGMYRRRAA